MALGRVGAGTPSSTHAHSFLQTQGGPAVQLPKAKEKTRQGVSTVVSEHRRQCAQCAGTREGPEPREGLAKASSSWGQARLPAPTPDKERPGPGELAAFPPLGAPGGALWRGLCLTPPLPPPARPRLGNSRAGGRAGGREG